MSRAAIKPIRRQELINATLESIAIHGLSNTTIMTISRIAGTSSGIISHYFGSKQKLNEAAFAYLLEELQRTFLKGVKEETNNHVDRLFMIIEANFSPYLCSPIVSKAWVSFWACSMHDPELSRLLAIAMRRLDSNLQHSFKRLGLNDEEAITASMKTAAIINGFWLKNALSNNSEAEFRLAKNMCKDVVRGLLDKQENT